MTFPSTTLKLVGIALLALALSVPLLFVGALVGERQGRLASAEAAIAEAQGRAQVLSPPILAWDELERVVADGSVRRVTHHLAPRDAELRAVLRVEERRRGIFRVPVYRVELAIAGGFAPDPLRAADARPIPGSIRLAWPIGDLRGVRAIGPVTIGSGEFEPESAALPIAGGEGLVVPIPDLGTLPAQLPYRLALDVSGTRELWFLPLARTTEVQVEGAWPSPSFAGAFLPVERDVGADGFRARWSVLGVNRRIPSDWTEHEAGTIRFDAARFGVVLNDPLSVYRLVERSLKYGLVFVGLTFGLAFVVEVLSGRRVHPVQYLLVGSALVVFYLLLLALSEHIGFGPAWVVSASTLIGIVGGYVAGVFGARRAGAWVAGWLALLYGFLWVMVTSEDHALLIGALGVVAMLAATMALTRRIDWYRIDARQRPDKAGEGGRETIPR